MQNPPADLPRPATRSHSFHSRLPITVPPPSGRTGSFCISGFHSRSPRERTCCGRPGHRYTPRRTAYFRPSRIRKKNYHENLLQRRTDRRWFHPLYRPSPKSGTRNCSYLLRLFLKDLPNPDRGNVRHPETRTPCRLKNRCQDPGVPASVRRHRLPIHTDKPYGSRNRR